MAKKGDKYVVTIDEVLEGDVTLYRAKGMRTLVFDDNGLTKLKPLKEEQGWIWVCDMEPKPGENVLISADGLIVIAWRNAEGVWQSFDAPGLWLNHNIDAWMPLPMPASREVAF